MGAEGVPRRVRVYEQASKMFKFGINEAVQP
jgi:hypothetical protein